MEWSSSLASGSGPFDALLGAAHALDMDTTLVVAAISVDAPCAGNMHVHAQKN